MRAAGVGHGLEPVKHCFSWQGAVRAVRAVRSVRVAGVGHGLEPIKHCFSWQGRCAGGVGVVRAVWAVWAVRAVRAVRAAGVGHGLDRKTMLFMAGALRWGR